MYLVKEDAWYKLKISYTGYHGTNSSCVDSIINTGFDIQLYSFNVIKGQKRPGDLGSGAYFFQDSMENAYNFALKENCNPAIVLNCTIEVDDEKVLDMDDPENLSIYQSVRNNDRQLKSLERRFLGDVGKRKNLDGLIIEYIIFKHKISVDLVRKQTYTPFNGLPPLSNFYNGIELCVRTNDIIVSKNVIDSIYQEG